MNRIVLALLLALAASACAYSPAPTDLVRIVDSPADMRACQRLADVSAAITTTSNFGAAIRSMMETTVALGGTHLYLEKLTPDWLSVRGIAYRCAPDVLLREDVVRAKG